MGSRIFPALTREIQKAAAVRESVIELLYTALLLEGAVLLHDVPGIGKTTLAKSMAGALHLKFSRIQGTTDLTPGDITGVSLYDPRDHRFNFIPGPIFCNVLLFDEINRATPKTQSALLEAMAEGQVTVDGVSHPLPRPFFLIATANPRESGGVFDLPESQLDRFLIRIPLGYPDRVEEGRVYRGEAGQDRLGGLQKIINAEDLGEESRLAGKVSLSEKLINFILDIAHFTRADPALSTGISPRGGQFWARGARALAFIRGRDFVTPDDLLHLAGPVLAHRLTLPDLGLGGTTSAEALIDKAIKSTPIPL